MISRRNENLNVSENSLIIFGIISYLVIYIALFVINKLWINLENYYFLILSAYFIIFSLIYMKIKKLSINNLLISSSPLYRDRGIFIGILIFFYYIICSNLFVSIIGINTSPNSGLLIIPSIIIAIISSEIFFRGIIQRGLKIKFNKNVSIAIQALLWSMLKADFFLMTFSTIHLALIGLILIYPIGLLLGYVKEEWFLDSSISASLTAGIISIIILAI